MSISKGIALITGSAQGIGRGIALRLAKDGFDIALNDVPSKHDQLRAVATDIDQTGRKTFIVPADVSVEEQVKGMVQDVTTNLGGLDVMVSNAGIAPLATVRNTEVDLWDHIMAVNLRGSFLCYKYAAEQMIKQGRGGRIIGASSIAGKAAIPLGAAYSASKFGIRGLTQTASLELGRYRITVNSYAPGSIDTPLTRDGRAPGGDFSRADQDIKDWFEDYLNRQSIKHEGQPEDIATIVSFLASKEAHFITGQCIAVDGGITLS